MRQITRRQFLKYGLAASAALAGAGYVVKNLGGAGDCVKMDSLYDRVLVVGVDGMDPKITRKLVKEGDLPNFEALAGDGHFSDLATSYPPNSPVAWTSIATGSNPGKHNIFDFIRRDAKTYIPQLSLSKSSSGTSYGTYVGAKRFWTMTSEAGVPTSAIRWPVSFPPEEVSASMLSGLGVPDIKGFLSGYSYYTTDSSVTSEKSSNNIVTVEPVQAVIETHVFGPKTVKSGAVVDVTSPMKITLGDGSVTVEVGGDIHEFSVGSWSPFMRSKFKVGFLKSVSGVFKAYLSSVDPFSMYLTAVQIDPEDPLTDISYPSGYSAELAQEIGSYYTLGIPEETDGFIDGRLDADAFIGQIVDIETQRKAMFDREYEIFKKKGGVLSFVFDSSDRIQHVFWRQKILEGDELKVSDAVRTYYRKKDEFLGSLTDDLGGDCLLMVVSDHGFTSFERSVSLNTWLVEEGFMSLKKDIPDGEDGALFKYVDWSKTKAYSLGFNSVYVNAAGREGKGIVSDVQSVVDELVSRLESLKDDKHGEKVVTKAYRRQNIYEGEYVGECPDVVVGFNRGYRMAWQTAIGGFTDEVLSDNTKKWAGDHLVDPTHVPGVLFCNQKLSKKDASQMDVAPTVLSALGVPAPDWVDGKSLI